MMKTFKSLISKIFSAKCSTEPISQEMTEALEYIRLYQAWRRGNTSRTMVDSDIDPKKLGEMIDRILDHFGCRYPEIKCCNCAHEDTDNVVTGCGIETCVFKERQRQ